MRIDCFEIYLIFTSVIISAEMVFIGPQSFVVTWTTSNITLSHEGNSLGLYEPNSEVDGSERFVPLVDLTHDDEDTHSHMSDIPLQLPTSANASSNNSAMLTFSQAEGAARQNLPCQSSGKKQ